MDSRNLEYLFAPRSVALIGATDRPQSVGATVMRNLLAGGFKGPIWPVNLRRGTVAGLRAWPSVTALPGVAELAVVCVPAPAIPALVAELGAAGTRAAVVISAGLEAAAPGGGSLAVAMVAAARHHGLRILGPNCLGLLLPRIGLNASFAHTDALPGDLAFIAQSGALTTAMLDWARGARIGFSSFISLGNCADLDFGDLIDHLGRDPATRAILLYVESVRAAADFLAAARAAARAKPVIVVKSGRHAQSAQAAASHSGALAGADEVYDAAFRRAGLLRVQTTRELFDAAETLALMREVGGPRLAIVTNGGGPGVMAADALVDGGGELAALPPATLAALDALLPASWSHGNPVDIVGDAPVERYAGALAQVLAAPGVDGVLLLHAPTAIVPPAEIARGCITLLRDASRPVLTCWMGGPGVVEARRICASAGVPVYATPEEAVAAFLHACRYGRNRRLLLQSPAGGTPAAMDLARVRAIVSSVLGQGRAVMTEPESKQLLAACGIATVATRVARGVEEALAAAAQLGYPVVLKILSPDISHKSDLGGVALDIGTPDALGQAAREMLERCRAAQPGARLEGFTVQPMVRRPGARELIAGIAPDRTFGPVILFGQGGTEVELVGDKALDLPPLDAAGAAQLMARTRVRRLLDAHRGRPAADLAAIRDVLVRLSALASQVAEVAELDINPLLADEHGVLALDARVRVVAVGQVEAAGVARADAAAKDRGSGAG